jgi:hypothetical protein
MNLSLFGLRRDYYTSVGLIGVLATECVGCKDSFGCSCWEPIS